jgi:hypothetical protein
VEYTHTDTANYNAVPGISVNIAVAKATPVAGTDYTVPTGLTATYGQTLANVTLPANFSWESATSTSVGNAGTNSFTVQFTHTDTANYNAVPGISVNIAVAKAAITPVVTQANINYGGTVSPSVTVASNPGNGTATYEYSATETGTYNSTVPSALGTHWVKATVPATTNYQGGTSAAVSFAITGGTPSVINAWVAGETIATSPASTATITRTQGVTASSNSLTINVTESGVSNSDITWTVDGAALPINGVTTGDKTLTFDATWKSDGKYNIGLSVTKGGKTYSETITVTVN